MLFICINYPEKPSIVPHKKRKAFYVWIDDRSPFYFMARRALPWENLGRNILGKTGERNGSKHTPLLGRMVLLPAACCDAMLELIKKVACAFAEAREGIKTIWGSFYNDRKTVRKGFTLFEESLSHVARIPMIPIRFAWQLICILKNKPCEITPLHCEN